MATPLQWAARYVYLVLVYCLLCILVHYNYESPQRVVTVPPRGSNDVGTFAGPQLCDRLIFEPVFQCSDRSYRNGHLYILQVLISYNADPTICDQQGFNTLHLVTHSSVIMALLYILHQPIAVDSPDAQGHTSLMWAAYQGDALSVELLLKHGASITSKDHTGLTALHWAVVRGNKVCIRKLVEAGADLNARDENGKTPREMAIELKSISAYKRALEEGGMSEDGHRKSKPLNDRNTKAAILILPAFFFFLIFNTFSILPWFTAIPLAFAEFFGMHHIVTRVLLNHKNYTENLTHSPYFSGIILGTMWWIAYCWITRLVKGGLDFHHVPLAADPLVRGLWLRIHPPRICTALLTLRIQFLQSHHPRCRIVSKAGF
jgi:ankyrin repeat protein